MRPIIIKNGNWAAIDFTDPAHRAMARACVQAYWDTWRPTSVAFSAELQAFYRRRSDNLIANIAALAGNGDGAKIAAAIDAYATVGDFPAGISHVIEKFKEFPDTDRGYEQIFDVQDHTNIEDDGFKIQTLTGQAAYAVVKPGGRIEVRKVTGAEVSVSYELVGGALGTSRTIIQDKKWLKLEDLLQDHLQAYDRFLARLFYALIEASTNNTAWQGVTADDEVTRDSKTINKAVVAIIDRLKDKGHGVGDNPRFKLLHPHNLKSRVVGALSKVYQAFAGSPRSVVFDVEPVMSPNLQDGAGGKAAASHYYLILPGRKLKGGIRQSLQLFGDFDTLSYTDTTAGWGRVGAGVGEAGQIERCATA